jgi:hypothetical protein
MDAIIRSFSELRAAIEALPPPREGYARVFRGQTRDFGKMIPTGLRTEMEVTDEAWMFYSELLAEDCRKMADQGGKYVGDDMARALLWTEAIKQHYGPGTNFLDVTHSLGVAGWFALHRSERVKITAVYGTEGPFDPDHDVVAEHGYVRYQEEKESPGWIYVFDVPQYSEINKQEHGVMVDLAEAPEAFSSSPRIRVQRACLIYADKEAAEGDLSCFFVPGTPLRVGWPLEGAPEVLFATEQIYPSPVEDDWYARFVSIPLRPQFDRNTRKAHFALPIRVGLYHPDEKSRLRETSRKIICLPPPLLFKRLIGKEPEDMEKAVSAWTPAKLRDSTPILLEGPLGLVLPPPDSGFWNQEILLGDIEDGVPTYDYVGGGEMSHASLRNVFFEMSPLEHAGWERIELQGGGQEVLRGVWLVRNGKRHSIALITQQLPDTGLRVIGPFRIRFSSTSKIFEFQIPADRTQWAPVTDFYPLARMLFKTMATLRDISPGLKVDQCPSMSSNSEDQWTYVVKIKDALAALASLAALGEPYGRYHLLLQGGDTKRYFGGARPGHPGFKGALTLESREPFSTMDAKEIKKMAFSQTKTR